MGRLYIFVPIFICSVLSICYVEGWTHLCPQTNLQLDCKCHTGEKCCFCPKPKILVSHQHAAKGGLEVTDTNPCEPIVIENGCTKGGICPPCPKFSPLDPKYTNDLCVDEPNCGSMAGVGQLPWATICSQFADVRRRCPVSCGDCYNDHIDCNGALVTDAMCAKFNHIRLKCAATCAAGPIVKPPVPVVPPVVPPKVPAVTAVPAVPLPRPFQP